MNSTTNPMLHINSMNWCIASIKMENARGLLFLFKKRKNLRFLILNELNNFKKILYCFKIVE